MSLLVYQASLPALGQDAGSVKWKTVTMDSSKQVVTSRIAAMNAATAQVVTLTAGEYRQTTTLPCHYTIRLTEVRHSRQNMEQPDG